MQIDDFYKNAVARTITMEDFVDQDKAKFEQYYENKAAELKERYGQRIQEFMMMPIIENIYKSHNLDSKDSAASAILWKTVGWKANSANKRDQKDPSVCPLYQ